MGGHGESQLYKHTAGIALHRGVDKIAAFAEFNDLIQLGIHFGLGHAQNSAVHVNIFTARHFLIEAGANLQHTGHAPVQPNFAFGGGGDAAQHLQHGAFACAVAANDAQRFALVNGQIHAVQRHKGFSEQAGISADLYIGVFLAAHTAPPALQIGRQCAAADLAQFILFF